MYSLSEVLVSKFISGPVFCFLCGFTYCVRVVFFLFRFSMFVRVLGVRRLLQVLRFGVSEVLRFECQRISGLIFQI